MVFLWVVLKVLIKAVLWASEKAAMMVEKMELYRVPSLVCKVVVSLVAWKEFFAVVGKVVGKVVSLES